MTSPSYIIEYKRCFARVIRERILLFAGAVILLMTAPLAAQRVAILAPDLSDQSREVADRLRADLAGKANVLDEMLSNSAFDSAGVETPFNLGTEETQKITSAIGCDFLILVRSSTLRRSASGRPEYYEANAAIFVASARTGSLIYFDLLRDEEQKPAEATEKLMRAAADEAAKIADRIKATARAELSAVQPLPMEQVPEPNSPAAKTFRPPVPYRRIKPIYTADAAYYDIKATVDIEVDLDAAGSIRRTQIKRWAGYGLDEAVETTVRSMNWKPAERGGRNLPIRVLLRYNFKKADKE